MVKNKNSDALILHNSDARISYAQEVKKSQIYDEKHKESPTIEDEGPNPIQLFSIGEATMQPGGKEKNIPLLWGGLHWLPIITGCNEHPIGVVALVLESWIELTPLTAQPSDWNTPDNKRTGKETVPLILPSNYIGQITA